MIFCIFAAMFFQISLIMRHLSIILMLCAVTLFGCKKTYTIVCKSSNEDWGTVTGGGEYRDGETAVLTATPTGGYYFLSWQDGDVSNPRIITVSGDATYTAKFADTPFGVFDGEPLHVSGKICTDQVWPDMGLDVDYIIDGTLYIGCNATIRVMPGVTIMFTGADGNIEVVENGALNMSGTENNPIVLCGPTNQQQPGSWGRVVVNSSRLDNTFAWVEFRNGGSSDDLHGGVVYVRGSLSMMCCTIDGSNGSGLVTEGECALPIFGYNIIQHCTHPWVTTSFPVLYKGEKAGNELYYDDMFNQYVYVDLDHYEFNESITLNSIGLAWFYFPHGFYFDGNGTLTLNDTRIFVGEGKQLRVGKNLSFKAYGSDTYLAPLSIDKPWEGMVFESERSDNIIKGYKFYVCGAWDQDNNDAFCLKITENAKLQLRNCIFGPARKYGVWIENIETWGNVIHSGNQISPIGIPYLVHIEHGGTFNGHTYADNTNLNQLP